MTLCKNCKEPIESSFAGGIGIYWFHPDRPLTGSAFCAKNSDDWSFSAVAEPLEEAENVNSN